MRNKLFLLAFIASASLYAEEIQLDKSIINSSSTYTGSVIGSESKNVVLVTKEDIQKKQYKNVVDIFKDSPVTMVTHTKGGDLVALRGSGEKTVMRVNILLNGNPINTIDENMGVIPFNAIPVDAIEKVEIIPGGGITLYGAGSSSGVINIITNGSNKNPYGSVSYAHSSFNTNNVQATKGIRLTDNLFADIAIEGEKGDAYRDKEKHKKFNALGGIEYKINDKNRVRFSGMKYKGDDDSTNEVSLFDLKRDRKKAGDTLSNVKSDRKGFGIDYEYKPTKNIDVNISLNRSQFTRDVDSDGRPMFTFLPSIPIFDNWLSTRDTKADLVLENVAWQMNGGFEEKIDSGKFKTAYRYNDGKGKVTVGYDYVDHSLMRKFDQRTDPYNEGASSGLLIHKENQRLFSEEEMKDKNILLLNHGSQSVLNIFFDPQKIFYKTNDYHNNPEFTRDELFNSEVNGEVYTNIVDKVLLPIASEEVRKQYNDTLKMFEEKYNYIVPPQERANMLEGMIANTLEQAYKLEPVAAKRAFIINYLKKEKIGDVLNKDLLEKVDGKEGLYVQLSDGSYEFVEFPKDMTIEELANEIQEKDVTKSTTQSFVSAKMDVNKKTNSFYLHNAYNLTDKLEIAGGIRYEQARYKGTRTTTAQQVITLDPRLSERERNYEISKLANAETGVLDNYIKGSDLTYLKQDHYYPDDEQPTYKYFQEKKAEIVKELKENGSVVIPMSNLKSSYEKTENNIGGEIGFTYSFNDTDQAYARYERAFNSPLPTQMTNKTFDPVHKMRVYWDSNIKTETMNNFEIGYRGMVTDNITFSAAAFLSDTNNEIATLVKDGNSHMTREWRFMNLDKTRRMGIELQSEQFFDKLNLKESFTYISPKIIKNNYERDVRKVMDTQRDQLIASRRNEKGALYFDKLKDLPEGTAIQEKLNVYYKEHPYHGTMWSMENHIKNLAQIQKYFDKNIVPIINSTSLDTTKKEELKRAVYAELASDLDYAYDINELYDSTYALKNGEYLEDGDEIPLAPKVKATLSADYQFTDKLKLGANFNYIGSFTSVEPARHYGVIKTKVPAHWVTDIYGTYDFTPDLSVKFGVNNVFNHEYNLREDSYTATPAAGRTYTAGFTYTF